VIGEIFGAFGRRESSSTLNVLVEAGRLVEEGTPFALATVIAVERPSSAASALLQALRETRATGLEPATFGVTGLVRHHDVGGEIL